MPEATVHPLQAERLRSLRSYEILDTDREAEFDEIVQLASAICEAPISVVNLIDAERQWFKAEVGLGVRETPLATSICSHAVLEQDFVEIPDLLQDPRMSDNPLCLSDGGLRFYAGALLKGADGLPIGTLCVLDTRPRGLTALQRDAIRVLARQVMAQLEMRRALRRASVLRQEVDHRVKNSLLSISALARIEGRRAPPEAQAPLAAVQNRIDAVATVHEMLYRTARDGERVDLADYLRRLAELQRALAPEGVAVHLDADPVAIDAREAAALGTLVNEMAANSFKHAFTDGRDGAIRIDLTAEGAGLRLDYTDDGVGLDPEAAMGSDGLGMSIAQSVCIDLGATLEIAKAGPGFAATLRFQPTTQTADAA